MDSMELANYLEKVRYGRKISQERFVEGICSLRQYQRYRSGECEVPVEKIEMFAVKLNIPRQKLLNEFEKEKNQQNLLIDEFYNAVVNQNRELIETLKKKIKKDIIIEEENKVYYHHALIRDDYLTNRITDAAALSKTKVLINFPNVLKNHYFTDIEILILSSMLNMLTGKEHLKLLERLSNLFDTEENILSAGNHKIYSLILMRLAKASGMVDDYERVIKLCDLAIAKGVLIKQFYLMENFYYYKALSHYYLEEFMAYEDSLFKCYNVLQLEGNTQKIDKFTERIESDFKINFTLFIINYLKKTYI